MSIGKAVCIIMCVYHFIMIRKIVESTHTQLILIQIHTQTAQFSQISEEDTDNIKGIKATYFQYWTRTTNTPSWKMGTTDVRCVKYIVFLMIIPFRIASPICFIIFIQMVHITCLLWDSWSEPPFLFQRHAKMLAI